MKRVEEMGGLGPVGGAARLGGEARVGVRLWPGARWSMESFQSGESGVGRRPGRAEGGSGLSFWPRRGGHGAASGWKKAGTESSAGRVGWGSAGWRGAGLKRDGSWLSPGLSAEDTPSRQRKRPGVGAWEVGTRQQEPSPTVQ